MSNKQQDTEEYGPAEKVHQPTKIVKVTVSFATVKAVLNWIKRRLTR